MRSERTWWLKRPLPRCWCFMIQDRGCGQHLIPRQDYISGRCFLIVGCPDSMHFNNTKLYSHIEFVFAVADALEMRITCCMMNIEFSSVKCACWWYINLLLRPILLLLHDLLRWRMKPQSCYLFENTAWLQCFGSAMHAWLDWTGLDWSQWHVDLERNTSNGLNLMDETLITFSEWWFML